MDDLELFAAPIVAPEHQEPEPPPAPEAPAVHVGRPLSAEEQQAIDALLASSAAQRDWATSPIAQWVFLTVGVGLVQEWSGDHARDERTKQDRKDDPEGARDRAE